MNIKIGHFQKQWSHFQAPLFRSEKLWIDLSSFEESVNNLVCKGFRYTSLDEIGIDTKPTL